MVTAEFNGPDGRVAGSRAGCDRVQRRVHARGRQPFAIGPVASTRMACFEPEGIGQQESAYFAALARVSSWSFQEERLQLRAADGALQVEFPPGTGSVAAPAARRATRPYWRLSRCAHSSSTSRSWATPKWSRMRLRRGSARRQGRSRQRRCRLGSVPGDIDLLVVGGPTHAHGMTTRDSRRSAAQRAASGLVPFRTGMREWLADLETPAAGIAGAAFDTRIKGPSLLWGSAAQAAAKELRRLGFESLADPASFLVKGPLGPVYDVLVDGELEGPRAWRNLGTDLAGRAERQRGAPA